VPHRPKTARIADILAAIGRIREHVADLSFEAFRDDRKRRGPLQLGGVIGEAAASLAAAHLAGRVR